MPDLSSTSHLQAASPKAEIDEQALARMMELEFAAQRAKWQRVSEKRNTFRAMSLFFLLAVIGAGLIAFFYFFSSGALQSAHPENVKQPTVTASPIKP